MSEPLTAERFQACLDEHFEATMEGLRLELRLIRVDVSASASFRAEARRAFSLVFRGPPAPTFAQRLYRLDHPRLGANDIFLVPIGPDAEGMCYEAVFN